MHREPLSASVIVTKNCMLLNLLENGSNNDAKNDQDAVHIITHTYVLVFYAQLYT